MKLSIIIPCYNCESTLTEAVDSCYTQGLSEDQFEIVMVNDGSADTTEKVMEQLATKYRNIRIYAHKRNRGGGAARNTGIKKARGELIYCLDGDNILAKNSLSGMIDFLELNSLDGAVFHHRRFFLGSNREQYSEHINPVSERNISLNDMFDDSDTLLDNFLYTKASYQKTAGYPEHHGFDTQCYTIRYLASGNQVRVCPQSIFYHRHGTAEPSYFERVYASGLYSVNFMLIFEDIFHLFNDSTQQKLIEYPLFSQNKNTDANILSFLKQALRDGNDIFRKNYQDYISPDGRIRWLADNTTDTLPRLQVSMMQHFQQKEYQEALHTLTRIVLKMQMTTPYLEFTGLRILQGLAGTSYGKITEAVLANITELTPVTTKSSKMKSFIQKNNTLYRFLRYTKHLIRSI